SQRRNNLLGLLMGVPTFTPYRQWSPTAHGPIVEFPEVDSLYHRCTRRSVTSLFKTVDGFDYAGRLGPLSAQSTPRLIRSSRSQLARPSAVSSTADWHPDFRQEPLPSFERQLHP